MVDIKVSQGAKITVRYQNLRNFPKSKSIISNISVSSAITGYNFVKIHNRKVANWENIADVGKDSVNLVKCQGHLEEMNGKILSDMKDFNNSSDSL